MLELAKILNNAQMCWLFFYYTIISNKIPFGQGYVLPHVLVFLL